jgi:hypothetical protein
MHIKIAYHHLKHHPPAEFHTEKQGEKAKQNKEAILGAQGTE